MYDIQCDTGALLRRVKRTSIKLLSADHHQQSNPDELSQGRAVEAKLPGWTRYYPGEISKVHGDGTFDIVFDDGEKGFDVLRSQIRTVNQPSNATGERDANTYSVGDHIEAKIPGWSQYYSGKITRVSGYGSSKTYDIIFDDGEKKSGVRERSIRKAISTRSSQRQQHGRRSRKRKYLRGDAVRVKYMGGATWKSAKIARVNSDNTYDVEYVNGERELRVSDKNIERAPGGASSLSQGGLGSTSSSLTAVTELEPLAEEDN